MYDNFQDSPLHPVLILGGGKKIQLVLIGSTCSPSELGDHPHFALFPVGVSEPLRRFAFALEYGFLCNAESVEEVFREHG